MDFATERYREGKDKNKLTIKELPIACAPDLSLKSIKTFIMTRRHRLNLIQVDDTLFISWNDSSDPSGGGEAYRIQLAYLCNVACIYIFLCLFAFHGASLKPRLMLMLVRGRDHLRHRGEPAQVCESDQYLSRVNKTGKERV